jgi:predicted DNA-binding transcriptional regulator YafY
MNRVERLTAIVMLLQDRPRNSVGIARHFEGSKRTILRDVQAVCEMGVPVTPAHDVGAWVAQDGVHGGYSLPPNNAPEPPALSAKESFLLLALRALGGLTGAPFGAARASLVANLRVVLPAAQMAAVDQWLDAVDLAVPQRGARSPFLEPLIGAAQAGQCEQGTRSGY